MGLSKDTYILTDVWSGEQYDFSDRISFKVRRHASKLFAVNRKGGTQLYDANIRITSAKAEGEALFLEADYAVKDAELTFDKNVKNIYICGEKIKFKQKNNTVCFDVPEAGTIKAEF